jgi:uncharacterized protein (TIGR02246 family)
MKISKTTSIALTFCLSSLLITPAKAAPISNTARTVINTIVDAPVHALIASLAEAATEGDAAKMASLFTLDGTYIDEDGVKTAGREALKERFAAGLAGQKTKTTANVQSIKRVGMNSAFVEGITCKGSTNEPEACARFTMLLQRQGNAWLISSATETEIVTKSPALAPVDRLSSLNWLIGTWSTSAGNAKVTMTADWVGNKNFILCKYVIDRPGVKPKVDVQIIGFDPKQQKIVSWNFDSTGGFGSGIWNKQGNEWLVRSTGVEQIGAQTGATNVISLDNENKFSWRSIDRVFDGKSVPNTEPLIVERVRRSIQ